MSSSDSSPDRDWEKVQDWSKANSDREDLAHEIYIKFCEDNFESKKKRRKKRKRYNKHVMGIHTETISIIEDISRDCTCGEAQDINCQAHSVWCSCFKEPDDLCQVCITEILQDGDRNTNKISDNDVASASGVDARNTRVVYGSTYDVSLDKRAWNGSKLVESVASEKQSTDHGSSKRLLRTKSTSSDSGRSGGRISPLSSSEDSECDIKKIHPIGLTTNYRVRSDSGSGDEDNKCRTLGSDRSSK